MTLEENIFDFTLHFRLFIYGSVFFRASCRKIRVLKLGTINYSDPKIPNEQFGTLVKALDILLPPPEESADQQPHLPSTN